MSRPPRLRYADDHLRERIETHRLGFVPPAQDGAAGITTVLGAGYLLDADPAFHY